MLVTSDGKAAYLNRSYDPAFFSANEVNTDIDFRTRQFGEQPNIRLMPHRDGFPDGVIATWGAVNLEPMDEQGLQLLARDQSPRAGFFIDFLNDPTLSAQKGLPVYRLTGGSPGYVWGATFDSKGKGKLRFLAISPSALLPLSPTTSVLADHQEGPSPPSSPEPSVAETESLDQKWTRLEQKWEAANQELDQNRQASVDAEPRTGTVDRMTAPQQQSELPRAIVINTRPNAISPRPPEAISVQSHPSDRNWTIISGLAAGVVLMLALARSAKAPASSGPYETNLQEYPQYAKAECKRCHIRLPKPLMVGGSKIALTGYSSGRTWETWTGRINERRRQGRSSGRTHWSLKEVWYCKQCSEIRARNRLWFAAFVVGLLLVLFVH